MKRITAIRKAVCAMANELKKAGYSLSQAFKRAWRLVKLPITIRAAGTTFENRQERLKFLQQFKQEDLAVTLEREKDNKFDSNAIQIVVHIKPIHRRTVIGYIPKGMAVYQPRTDMGKDKGSVKWYQDVPTGRTCGRGQKG